MARIWERNEETDEDEELVVTEHRDGAADDALERVDEEDSVEVTTDDPREALEELGEDVSSSPARRGHDNSPESGE